MPTFTEAWFPAESQKALANLVRNVQDIEGDIVEVGCWEGRSTLALADACHPAVVHAVDTWQGSPGELSAALAEERDVLATFLANTAGRNIDVFIMGWRDYFDQHRDPVRFLHIDAAHTYEEVRDNIVTCLPLMAPGAVMCGDDVHHPPIQEALTECFGTWNRIATLWWVSL